MKASAIKRAGQGWQDVYKSPITDQVKKSKRGRLELIQTDYGTWETRRMSVDEHGNQIDTTSAPYGNKLKVRYTVGPDGGYAMNRTTFSEVRERAAKGIQ